MGAIPRPENLTGIHDVILPMLRSARIPGAALAVVIGAETVFAQGFGYCDLASRRPVTCSTIYPIASTTKAFNATLLGMLVEAGQLSWDVPVQNYCPDFRLRDPLISTQVTLRDLLVMRTGLPRHDWAWEGRSINRPELVHSLRYLDLSAGFRKRFQYCNLTATAAGYIAEVVTGRSWEGLLQEMLLMHLRMRDTGFGLPAVGDVTSAYHENHRRELVLSRRMKTESTGPSGGSVHSNVIDMARWLSFNLKTGKVDGSALIQAETLAEIHSPQIVVGSDTSAPTSKANYAMGWFVDSYCGRLRLSHGGYVHDVNSEVSIFPREEIGIVSFTNFGCPMLARLINEQAFDLLVDFASAPRLDQKLDEYEGKIRKVRDAATTLHRVENTEPSHALQDYAGRYAHPGYGIISICRQGDELLLYREDLTLTLQHLHYDVWTPKAEDTLVVHLAHGFDPSSRVLFESSPDGAISAILIRLEPTVAPIRFEKV